jgi:hypothetical protein
MKGVISLLLERSSKYLFRIAIIEFDYYDSYDDCHRKRGELDCGPKVKAQKDLRLSPKGTNAPKEKSRR